MKPRLVILFLSIVLVPILVLIWFGLRLAASEQQQQDEKLRQVLSDQLSDVNDNIQRTLRNIEQELKQVSIPSPNLPPETFREIVRKNRLIRQVFLLNAQREFLFPPKETRQTKSERKFMERSHTVWESGIQFGNIQKEPTLQNQSKGWHTWFWGSGLQFVYWQRLPDGSIFGFDVEPMAIVTDIITELPVATLENKRYKSISSISEIAVKTPLPNACIMLRNTQGKVIYQWGGFEPSENANPFVTLALSAPLKPWSLSYYTTSNLTEQAYPSSSLFNIFSGIFLLMATLVALSIWYYREQCKAIREASQKVSFVNQVSHELKTPLTNIRMFAELLNDDISEEQTGARKRLAAVVSESQRLSRLINNVLTFAKANKGQLRFTPQKGSIDNCVTAVIDQFKATFEKKEIEIVFSKDASTSCLFDPDIVQQILGNLFSNVEKYASDGKWMKVSTKQNNGNIEIKISDKGPGVAKAHSLKIFTPFYRISDKLSDGVTGTGIGLAIAKELAQTHGGDLILESTSNAGSIFKLTLAVTYEDTNR